MQVGLQGRPQLSSWKLYTELPLPCPLPVLLPIWNGRGTEIPGGVPESKALGYVAQVEHPDVENVLEGGWIGRIRPNEGLQSWNEKGRIGLRWIKKKNNQWRLNC